MEKETRIKVLKALIEHEKLLSNFEMTDFNEWAGIVYFKNEKEGENKETITLYVEEMKKIENYGLIVGDFGVSSYDNEQFYICYTNEAMEVINEVNSENDLEDMLNKELNNDGGDTLEQRIENIENALGIDNTEKDIENDFDYYEQKDVEIDDMLEERMKDYFGDYYENFDEDIKNILANCDNYDWEVYEKYLQESYLTNNEYELLYDNDLVDTLYAHCDICGEVYEVNDMRKDVNDGDYNYVCEDCYDNGSTCDRCGYWFEYSDDVDRVNTRYGDEWWCDDCIDDHAFYCNGYEEYYDENDCSSYEVNGDTYSSEYCENHFYYCEECENYVDGDDWDSDYDCCSWCAEENHSCSYDRVSGYHERPEQYLYGKVAKNVKSDYHHIGIELEIDKNNKNSERELLRELAQYYDIENHELYFNHDGSLDYGFEIITQPHTYEAFKKMNWEKLLDACVRYGYKSHDTSTCGLHLHISRELLGATKDKQDRAITKLMMFIDANWNDIVKVSRRKGEELDHWARKCRDYGTNKENYINKVATEDYKKNAKNKYAFGRYMALNNTNYGTVEFRFMKGTLNYNSFMACIDFLYRIAINSKTITYKNILNNKLWLKGISENTKAYLRQRNAFLDAIED